MDFLSQSGLLLAVVEASTKALPAPDGNPFEPRGLAPIILTSLGFSIVLLLLIALVRRPSRQSIRGARLTTRPTDDRGSGSTRRRRRRHPRRPPPMTLAKTGGLPPIRDDGTPKPMA